MDKLNVAVADDNERILDLFGTLIENDRELELVGSAITEKICMRSYGKNNRMLFCWISLCRNSMELVY